MKKLISKLLNDQANAKISDAASAGVSWGSTTLVISCNCEAPRSMAASSCDLSKRTSRAETSAVTSGKVTAMCMRITVISDSSTSR